MARRDLPPRPLREEERHLWQQAVQDVRPLGRSHAMPSLPPAPPPPRRASISPPPFSADSPERAAPLPLRHSVPAPEAALDPQLKRRLRRGVLTPEARLDLHGLHEAAAFAQLSQFLEHCARADRRFVLVITGKGAGGHGRLRASFARWMEVAPLHALVQAYEPAQPRDGGTGAFYVKLRRARKD
jgi:DNA-nicking Smr family endonuclease